MDFRSYFLTGLRRYAPRNDSRIIASPSPSVLGEGAKQP